MKKKINRSCRLILQASLLLLFNKTLFAQTNSSYSQIIPPSPTSVQFQRYGDYPVSYFSGLPDITIPIYTIHAGDITVPITLSYHASGTRVDDVSGVVGLGWTLNTGGMISRTINGLPDESSVMTIPPNKAAGLDVTQEGTIATLENMENGTNDYEYDLYSYNFLGKSGKFIPYAPTRDGQPFVLQRNSSLLFNGATTIIDENGIVYNFGGSLQESSNAVEYQEYQDRFSVKTAISTWHLTSISSSARPGMGVSYSYAAGPTYIYYKNADQYILDDFPTYYITWQGFGPENYPYSHANAGDGVISGSRQVKNYTKVVSEIDFPGGKIIFNQDPTSKMVTSINIYDYNNVLIKSVTLNITAFPSNWSQGLDVFSNYKLQSVSINNAQNNTVENYSFNYAGENVADAKPRAFFSSAGKDHWGFYNGDDGRTNDLSWYPTLFTNADPNETSYAMVTPIGRLANRAPTGSAMAYVLNKITYPTGGYTTFDFELNRTAQNVPMGGLRIKTISNYLGNGQLATQKNYTYNTAFVEVTPVNEDYVSTVIGSLYGGQDMFRRLTISENSSVDFTPQGSPVVYPSVSESDGNVSTTYTYDCDSAFVYQAVNLDAGYSSMTSLKNFPQYPPRCTNFYKPWNFGNLLGKTTIGTGFMESVANEYEEFVTDTVRDFLMNRRYLLVAAVNNPTYQMTVTPHSFDIDLGFYHQSPWNFADHYYLSGGRRLKKSTTIYTANGSGTVETTKNYHYDNTNYPWVATRVESANSKGENLSTVIKHPYDYPETHPYDDMVSINQVTPTIEQTVTNTTLGKQLSHSMTNYDYFTENPSAQYASGQSGYIGPKTLQKSVLGNTLETDITINAYDPAGNVRQLTGRDGIITTYLYGYGALYPVAKIVGKDYATASQYVIQSVLDNPSSDAAILAQLNNLRTSLPDAQVSTFIYKPLVGITSATDPKGKITYYEYDSFQRLQTVRDQDGKILKSYTYNYQH